MAFVHLHVHSCYSFLDGASQPETLARRAAEQGMTALALTDHHSVAGMVKFIAACQQYHLQPIPGAEVALDDGSHLTLLAQSPEGYHNLNRLLGRAYQQGRRLTPALPEEILARHTGGLICLSGCRKGRIPTRLRQGRLEEAEKEARRLLDCFGRDHLFIELQDDWTPHSLRVCQGLVALGRRLDIRVAATNNVHYARPEDCVTHDLLRAIAAGVSLDTPHPDRPLNRERSLKSAAEMEQVFSWCPEALAATVEIAERCSFALPNDDMTPRYPGGDAPTVLRQLAYRGARERYGSVTCRVRERLEQELRIIITLGFADYMLMCQDIVRWAREEQNIRMTGRGSAADSCVAYCLRLTDVDVIRRNLPFARFLLPGKTPDIDVDAPSDRRDEIFRHVQTRYGEDRVGLVCTFFTYHARSAVRDVGKALALPPDVLAFFSERLYHPLGADEIETAFEKFYELRGFEGIKARCKRLFELCGRIAGFPRHLGSHSSGLLVSREPLARLAPLIPGAKGVLPIFTLDKDDTEDAGGIKFDLLALRILSTVADAEKNIRATADPDFSYEDGIPLDDPATFAMLRQGRAIGAFQVESAAQLALSHELLPGCFEDLVAAVSLIRPAVSSNSNRGAIVRASTVRRYLKSRAYPEAMDCIHPCLQPILAPSFGVIIWQEQVDQVIAAMTGWSEAQAERFRKSLTGHTAKGTLDRAGEKFIDACRKKHPDLGEEKPSELWHQIQGWGGFGFTQAHAASFALTAYKTSWLSVHKPAAFYAGLLNHQPMGYYPANTLAAEARRRGVTLLPLDINQSDEKCQGDREENLRPGLRLVAKLSEAERQAIFQTREAAGPFLSLLDFCVRVVLRRDSLENLLLAGAFDSLHPHRRGLLLRLEETLTLAAAYRSAITPIAPSVQRRLPFGSWREEATPCADDLPDFDPWQRLLWEWRITGICAHTHPLAFFREKLSGQGILTVDAALRQPEGARIEVAGLNIRPHRPPTRSGRRVLFSTLEDETGFLQVLVIADALERCTATFLLAPAVQALGRVERRGEGGAALHVENARPLRV